MTLRRFFLSLNAVQDRPLCITVRLLICLELYWLKVVKWQDCLIWLERNFLYGLRYVVVGIVLFHRRDGPEMSHRPCRWGLLHLRLDQCLVLQKCRVPLLKLICQLNLLRVTQRRVHGDWFAEDLSVCWLLAFQERIVCLYSWKLGFRSLPVRTVNPACNLTVDWLLFITDIVGFGGDRNQVCTWEHAADIAV